MTIGEPLLSYLVIGAFGSIFVGVYVLVLLYLAMAWFRTRSKLSTVSSVDQRFISIVVPYKNEGASLPSLMEALEQQNVAPNLFEVIAVNDHSEDGGMEWLSGQALFKGSLLLIDAQGCGKKNALREGILSASGDLIVTIDADCVPGGWWLAAIMDCFRQTGADMLIGPVKMRSDGSFLSNYESIDYYALQMSGAGSAMLGVPVFCSGANLSFRKAAWVEALQNTTGLNVASGDDVFLLHAFKRLRKKILFVKDRRALVETPTSGSLAAFFRQRMRWGGKSTSYKDRASIALAIVVLMANLWLVFLLPLWLCSAIPGWLVVVTFILKVGADFLLLRQGRQFYGVHYSILTHFWYSVLYPFVLVATAAGGLLLPVKWK